MAQPLDIPIEHLLRELTPQVLGAVVRRFHDFASAEDAVQEALLAAAQQWPRDGVPDNPRGWLIQVAARRMMDHLRSEEARRLFSVVPQSPFFFHASIRENLSLALPEGSEGGEGAIRAALETAQLTKMVAALPDGLETTVGERGLELSAGEARRLAVARALLKEAAVYVLDEPTEGLDERTADALMDALDVRLRAKTLIVISHRERDMRFMHTVVRLGN